MYYRLFVVSLALVSCIAFSKGTLITNIEKSGNDEWTVEYISQKPIRSISFASAPDDSRSRRWLLLSEGFTLRHLNNSDIITRPDGNKFERVKFKLTPTYTHLPKAYAPFSPFSDGGMLFHSGRFFACAELCSPIENAWYISLTVPNGENIIVNGKVTTQGVSWWDNNGGRKVYVGQKSVVEEDGFISIIDDAISQSQGAMIERFLPDMMKWLEKHYGRLSQKPMLFASYSITNDGSYGQQGGTLPDQVFMHWYGKLPDFDKESEQLVWFFAHEAAHMYQRLNGRAISPVDNWLHEGHAEHIAKKIVMQLYPKYQSYADNMSKKASKNCRDQLAHSTLHELVENNQHKVLYQCGLYIFDTIDNASTSSNGVHLLWNQFMRQIKPGQEVSGVSFIELAGKEYALPEEELKQLMLLVQ
ncbi:hypothetical protein [Thalassotalea fusca]